ncbi:uncharacterized protein TRAVEDRAFT_42971 [Trametes versicolor FP-101664 SS1]|uniref:uncharacterized protein n=1 Tax=Trametes versicolor (strain FP-101664) TaxID=717944 RepID=UPI0004622D69|nr:uncharacterized protein TRAVEDRAFT_42971 [Trametes versicolor FP-101664 SS1]EIW62626.1 hypothetical protein TRAVEDRAFT_42971 [Trametes versicolor FP-101664 SS1]
MEILEASIKLLEIAKLVTADIPVPGLNTALECALSIAKKAKEIKDTRDECRALAQRAADLVLIIYEQLKNDSGQTAAKEHVTMFLHNLLDIENLMVRRLQAGTGERILFAFNIGKIAKEVQTLTARLEESYRNFMIQAALSIHQSMDTLTSGNVRMLQHIDDSAHVGEAVLGDTRKIRTDLTDLALRVGASAMFDGNFRLFARENLTFLEPIVELAYKSHHAATQQRDEHTAIQATARPRTGRVFRYRAIVKAAGELSGTNVVVYTYPNRGIERFTEAIKFAKQSCHPYVPAILGYSRPGGPGEAAYIVTEDLGEMCIEYELGTGENQKRWKRYQFSYIPVNTTFLFQQWVHVLDELDAASRMIRSLPDLTCVLESYPCIGIVPHRYLYTETTITMGAHAAAEQVFPPLWFFALQFDSGDNFAHDCNIPCGFWSSDKYPTSIPADIIFDPTPQSEPVWTDIEAPLFTSTQILGDLIFTTQTKMETMIKRFSEDELLAFRELQFSHHS